MAPKASPDAPFLGGDRKALNKELGKTRDCKSSVCEGWSAADG